jgi:hypothetical protein
MNCSTIDAAAGDIERTVRETAWGFGIAVSLMSVLSLVLLVRGEHYVRPLVATLGGAGGGVAFYTLVDTFGGSCVPRVVGAVVAALVVSLAALCLLKAGLFFLGGAGTATVVHFVYKSLPLDEIAPDFDIVGLSGVYVIAVASSALLGGVVACVRKDDFLRLGSSVLGGGGLAAAAYLIWDRIGHPPPPLVLLVVFVAASMFGVFYQAVRVRRVHETARV